MHIRVDLNGRTLKVTRTKAPVNGITVFKNLASLIMTAKKTNPPLMPIIVIG